MQVQRSRTYHGQSHIKVAHRSSCRANLFKKEQSQTPKTKNSKAPPSKPTNDLLNHKKALSLTVLQQRKHAQFNRFQLLPASTMSNPLQKTTRASQKDTKWSFCRYLKPTTEICAGPDKKGCSTLQCFVFANDNLQHRWHSEQQTASTKCFKGCKSEDFREIFFAKGIKIADLNWEQRGQPFAWRRSMLTSFAGL